MRIKHLAFSNAYYTNQEVIPHANDLQGKFFNPLQEMSLNVRGTAAGALFTIGDTHSLEALLADLNDEDLLVWGGHHGVWRLVGDGRTVKRLIAGLMDENEDMRKASAKSLEKLG